MNLKLFYDESLILLVNNFLNCSINVSQDMFLQLLLRYPQFLQSCCVVVLFACLIATPPEMCSTILNDLLKSF